MNYYTKDSSEGLKEKLKEYVLPELSDKNEKEDLTKRYNKRLES